MKTILIILSILFLSKIQNDGQYGNKYNYSRYKGKTILMISYCDGCATSGDYLNIYFTDGTKMRVYAYKYNMQIQ